MHVPPTQGMTRSVVALATILAACSGEPTRPDWDGVGVLGEYIVYNGAQREYSLYVPESYSVSDPAPLVIMFHGAGGTGADFQAWSGMDAAARAGGFVVAYPNGKGSYCPDDTSQECPPFGWDSTQVGLVRELIAHLRHELAIDPGRVFAAGFSNGAVFTYDLVCEAADAFAAVAAVAALLLPETAAACAPSRPIAILLMNGTEDQAFPWDGGIYLSAASTTSFWVTVDGCATKSLPDSLPDSADDGTRVWTVSYRGCDDGVEVLQYGIEGGGHTWPGVAGFPDRLGLTSFDISASEEIVGFFRTAGR